MVKVKSGEKLDSAKILLKTEANLLLRKNKSLTWTRFAPSRFFWQVRLAPRASGLEPFYSPNAERFFLNSPYELQAISYELNFYPYTELPTLNFSFTFSSSLPPQSLPPFSYLIFLAFNSIF
ncbi:MAG: hypothetical protein HY787_02090 [Deltaproteobacteria bacterium]|nr:hypothetical protein [Deltaproteobacteria bacterium]